MSGEKGGKKGEGGGGGGFSLSPTSIISSSTSPRPPPVIPSSFLIAVFLVLLFLLDRAFLSPLLHAHTRFRERNPATTKYIVAHERRHNATKTSRKIRQNVEETVVYFLVMYVRWLAFVSSLVDSSGCRSTIRSLSAGQFI